MSFISVKQEVEKNLRHNIIVNMLDGACFWFGYSFMNPAIILPLFVSHLTNNSYLIALVSVVGSIGYLFPQLFTANWVERQPLKKWFPVNLGFFSERLPLLLLAPATFLLAGRVTLNQNFAPAMLAVFFILLVWHSAGAGLVAVGWSDMIGKVIPVKSRGRFFGMTNFFGTASGVLGASLTAWVLGEYTFPIGYAISFAIAAGLIFLSWVFIAQTREIPVPSTKPVLSQNQYFHSLPTILKSNPNFTRYLISQGILTLGGMAAGFLVVYASQNWHIPDSQASRFTMAMLIGQALANLTFGPLADRLGHKIVLEVGALAAVISYGLALLAPSPDWFFVIFGLRGVSSASFMISGIMISLEFCTTESRPTYIGLSNTWVGLTAGIAPFIGGFLVTNASYPWLFILAALVSLTGLLMLKFTVQEPRHRIGD